MIVSHFDIDTQSSTYSKASLLVASSAHHAPELIAHQVTTTCWLLRLGDNIPLNVTGVAWVFTVWPNESLAKLAVVFCNVLNSEENDQSNVLIVILVLQN